MSRLIDADDFRREIDKHWPFTKEEQCKHGIADMAKSELLYVLNQMPTIEERKIGRWLWQDGVRCSNCNYKLQTTGLLSYCPNCGARMET